MRREMWKLSGPILLSFLCTLTATAQEGSAPVGAGKRTPPAPQKQDKPKKDEKKPEVVPLTVGKKAVPFQAKALNGAEIDLPANFKGKLVLVDFWATWSPRYAKEVLPHVVEAQEKYRRDELEIVGVSLDKSRGKTPDDVAKFIKDNKMAWPQIYDDGDKLATDYGVDTIPAAFLIDGDTGVVLALGKDLQGAALAKTLEKHLKNKASGGKPGSKKKP